MRTHFAVMLFTTIFAAALPAASFADDDPTPREAIEAADAFAYSIDGIDEEFVVRVSPARSTLSIVPYGTWVGGAVDVVRNDRFKRRLDDALSDYPAGEFFADRIREGLAEHLDIPMHQVPQPGSWAGYDSKEDYEEERFEAIAELGSDVLLDLDIAYGIYGASGSLVTVLEGRLYTVPDGHRTRTVSFADIGEPILGTTKFRGALAQAVPSALTGDIRLTPEGDAIDQWTANGGELLIATYTEAVDGLVEAMLTALGLSEGSRGRFYLGKFFLYDRDYEEAIENFERALELEPDYVEARNALIVAHGKRKGEENKEAALAYAEALVADHPNYGPGWYNLSWLRVFELDDAASAKEPYETALELGMPEHRRMARKIRRATD